MLPVWRPDRFFPRRHIESFLGWKICGLPRTVRASSSGRLRRLYGIASPLEWISRQLGSATGFSLMHPIPINLCACGPKPAQHAKQAGAVIALLNGRQEHQIVGVAQMLARDIRQD